MADKKSATVMWIAAGAAVVLLAGVGVTWLVLGNKVESLERQVTELEASADATAAAESVAETGTAPAVGQTEVPAAADPAAEEPTAATEVQPGLVQGIINDGGTWKLTIDYVQFLTGAEAATAAAAHGDESPPPNDFYVVNDNPKIREFPVQAGIGVVVVTNNDGTSDPGGHPLSLSQWASALNGPSGPVFRSTIYWVTVTNGTITAINAQYTP